MGEHISGPKRRSPITECRGEIEGLAAGVA